MSITLRARWLISAADRLLAATPLFNNNNNKCEAVIKLLLCSINTRRIYGGDYIPFDDDAVEKGAVDS